MKSSAMSVLLLALSRVGRDRGDIEEGAQDGRLEGEGQTVLVDDGSCPKGQVKRVVGGNHLKVGGTKQNERSRTCVPR